MRQYSADRVSFAWAPFFSPTVSLALGAASAATGVGDLSDGLAQGTFLQAKQNQPAWRQIPNGVGGTVRIRMPASGGQLTALFDAESMEHMILVTLANADTLTRLIIGPLVILDKNTLEADVYTDAYLSTIPDLSKSNVGSVMPWVWNYTDRVVQPVGFIHNTVGD